MQLYATTTSERSTKGQGGEYLDITITGQNKEPLMELKARYDSQTNIYTIDGYAISYHGQELNNIDINLKKRSESYLKYELAGQLDPKSCDNCESTKGYSNSSGEWQCDNCGYSETE